MRREPQPDEPPTAPAAEVALEVPVVAHRLVRDIVIYGAGGVGLQLLLSLAVPFFTRIFTPADYGVIETTATMLAIAALLASLGLDSASQRSYFDYADDQADERRRVLGTTVVIVLATSLTVAAVGVALADALARLLFGDEDYARPLALAAATLPVAMVANFFLEVLRLRAQPGRYSLVAVLSGVVGVALALLLAGVADGGLSGYYAGLLGGGAVAVAVGFFLVRGAVRIAFDRRELRVMLAYGLPLVPVAASAWVLQFVDRLFLLRYSSLDELGLYGVGVRISNLLLLAVTAFSLAWSPFMLDLHQRDPDGERRARGRVLTVFVLVLAFGALVVSVYAHELLRVVTPDEYVGAYKVVGLLSGAVVAMGVNAVTMSEISLARRTGFFLRYALYAGALNIGLNFLLIPPWGMVGAALATLLTYAALSAMYYWRAQRIRAAPFDLRRVVSILAAAALLVAAGSLIHIDPLWHSILLKLPLLAAYPVLLRLLGVLERGWFREAVAWARTFFRHGLAGRAAPGTAGSV